MLVLFSGYNILARVRAEGKRVTSLNRADGQGGVIYYELPSGHFELRHSFASYHQAKHQDAARLALDMGHTSPHMIFDHYREIVSA